MEKTLHDLGRILLNAVPTFFIVAFLIFYLRFMFFAPMARLLQRRYDETDGAQKAADESMRQAEMHIAEYEDKLRAARGEIYAAQEAHYRDLDHENQGEIEKARREAEGHIARATADLRTEAERARELLEQQSGALAEVIVRRVLGGRAA